MDVSKETSEDSDEKSIFVKNVEYTSTKEEIAEHFKECGKIVRVTIKTDKATRKPIGCVYIEFETKDAAIRSRHLNESVFKGRQITVSSKRKNIIGFGQGN